MKKKTIAKLSLATGCMMMMLHWPRANATILPPQGMDSIAGNSRSVLVYPNPVMAALNIQSRKPVQQLILYSMDGKAVKKVTTTGKRNQLYVQDIMSGAYMLKTIFEDGTRTSKMIIKQ